MALGGGTWDVQNRILPGSYINFVAAQAASAFGERGVAAMPFESDWCPDGEVFTVAREAFLDRVASQRAFGRPYDAPELAQIRELFRHASKARLYRVAGSGAAAAENALAVARCKGTRGNDIKIVVAANIDDPAKFDVATVLGTQSVDRQTVADASGLAANAFVEWKPGAVLAPTAGMPLTGGDNGAGATGAEYQAFLDAVEGYQFNTLALPLADAQVSALFAEFTRRRREDDGVKFQAVLYRTAADYEGVVSVENSAAGAGANPAGLVPWVAGLLAGASPSESATNAAYDGELEVDTVYSQADLENAIADGKFAFHKVGDGVRVLLDINSLVSAQDGKNAEFKSNKTIRVIDEIATAIAAEFNDNFLGKVPNDAAGRTSFWSRVVEHHKALQSTRAIEGFSPGDVAVELGDDRKTVIVTDSVFVTGTMEKLYMTVLVE
jgi:hypothetical protein